MNAKTISPSCKKQHNGVSVKRVLTLLISEKATIILMIVGVLGEWYGVITDNDKLTALWALFALPFLMCGMLKQEGNQ